VFTALSIANPARQRNSAFLSGKKQFTTADTESTEKAEDKREETMERRSKLFRHLEHLSPSMTPQVKTLWLW
jgi:hypothetical protein